VLMTICAIHQPNFFPWAGYFDKIRQADVFIFLDEVAYPKSGSGSGSWCNRVKLPNAGKPTWFGLPINREPGIQLIKDVNFSNKEYNVKKLLRSLEFTYKKAPSYNEVMELIRPLLCYPSDNLADYNINAIVELSGYLGLKTQFVRQSALSYDKQQHSTQLLIELIKQVNAGTYLCGNGCHGYQQDTLFKEASVELVYQNYDPTKDRFIIIQTEMEGSMSILNHLFCAESISASRVT